MNSGKVMYTASDLHSGVANISGQQLPGSRLLLVFLSLFALILTGCGETNVADLEDFVKEVKARKKSNIPPLPKPQTYETYSYDQTKLRDPFTRVAPPRVASTNNGISPNFNRKRDVLEQFPLDTLRMMGSLEQGGEQWALVKANDGTLYRVKRGQHMGQDNGRIRKVTETQIELEEIVPDGLGGWVKRTTSLSVSE